MILFCLKMKSGEDSFDYKSKRIISPNEVREEVFH